MDMLERFLGHDAAASRALFVPSLGLSDEQLLRRLGVPAVPEGDMLGWERELRGGWEPAG
jgi:hypothetical protein